MRTHTGTAIATALSVTTLLLTLAPAGALEKTGFRKTSDRAISVWNTGTTCSVSYYNRCTGWLWVWGNLVGEDVLGIVYDPCCEDAILESTSSYVWTGAIPGWGFTNSSIEVSTADDNGCPDIQLARKTWLPASGMNVHTWGLAIPGPIVVTMTTESQNGPPPNGYTRVAVASDRPAGGPTGPQSSGFCYPPARLTHSFYYGNNVTGRNCPGSPLFDGVGNAEWLWWSAAFSCPVSTDEASWGSIKALYR